MALLALTCRSLPALIREIHSSNQPECLWAMSGMTRAEGLSPRAAVLQIRISVDSIEDADSPFKQALRVEAPLAILSGRRDRSGPGAQAFSGLASNSNKSRNYLVHIPISAIAKLVRACRNKLTKPAFCAMLFTLITSYFSAHRPITARR